MRNLAIFPYDDGFVLGGLRHGFRILFPGMQKEPFACPRQCLVESYLAWKRDVEKEPKYEEKA